MNKHGISAIHINLYTTVSTCCCAGTQRIIMMKMSARSLLFGRAFTVKVAEGVVRSDQMSTHWARHTWESVDHTVCNSS